MNEKTYHYQVASIFIFKLHISIKFRNLPVSDGCCSGEVGGGGTRELCEPGTISVYCKLASILGLFIFLSIISSS